MNFAVILFALMAIFTMKITEASDNASVEAVNTLKRQAQDTTDGIRRFSIELPWMLKSELAKKMNIERANIYDMGNVFLASVRSRIKAAGKEGRYVEHCYGSIGLEIWMRQTRIERLLEECEKSKLSLIDHVKENIDGAVVMGDLVINALNKILIDCCSSNKTESDNCVNMKLPQANIALTGLENHAETLHATGGSILTEENTFCEDSHTENFLDEIVRLDTEASSCIDKKRS